jgi:hypothetical protein
MAAGMIRDVAAMARTCSQMICEKVERKVRGIPYPSRTDPAR